MLSSVFAILYANRPGRPPSRYQKTGATTPSLKFSARLSIAARATPCRSSRAGSRPTIWLTASRPGRQPAAVAAPPRPRRHARNRLRCAIRIADQPAPRPARRARLPRHSACDHPAEPGGAADQHEHGDECRARAARRSLRCRPVELALEEGDRPARPATIGMRHASGTRAGMSPNSASIARPASSSSSGSCRAGGVIAAAVSAVGRRRSIGRSEP